MADPFLLFLLAAGDAADDKKKYEVLAKPERRIADMVEPVPAIASKSLAEAHRRGLRLYKTFLRSVPHIISKYELGFSVVQVRARITREFIKYKHIKDLMTIDFLLFKGTNELMELRNQWKTKSHVLGYFNQPKETG